MKSVRLDGEDIYPSKIVCIGRNYIDHINELNNDISEQAVMFMKPNSSISSDIYSNISDVIHYEGEISFLISSGKISGVGFGLDLTKREIQSGLKAGGLPWERAKAFDRSAVFSDFVTFNGKISDLRMELYINGRLAQQGGYDSMLYKPDDILNEAKAFLSFEDGDLIMSGTPGGTGLVNAGDEYAGRIYEKNSLLVECDWVVK